MLGIAVNLNALEGASESPVTADRLVAAASRLHNDALLTSVMTALWRNAEVHGLSGAFFEHGIDVLLNRLASFQLKQSEPLVVHPLKGARLQQVLDLMENRLGDDVRVAELAALISQDSRTFTRSFKAATGYAPYAYFTLRRMEYAKQLLRNERLGITDIAFQVGYTNPSKFSTAFRRICGASPSVWRQIHNN
jgi:AraC family transcriptional regulator